MRHFPSRGAGAVAALAVFACLGTIGANIGAATEKSASHSRRNPIVQAVDKTKAAIVTVRVPRPNGVKDLIGTGVVIDERGYIVTNRHVVGASRQVKIRLVDGTTIDGQVVWSDAAQDLAVVHISTDKKLQALELAPVGDLMVGETVIAVGHPFGYTNTVSTGIISALGREIEMPSGDTLTGLIQTNASINPGNSGGPLLNINGELIGINVALRDGAQGIAFAINAGTVKQVLETNFSALKMSGVHHGLKCKEKVLGETGDRQRVVVAAFQGDALKNGDEIRAVAHRPVANSFDVERALWDKKPGESVTLQVVRQGESLVVTLTLASGSDAGLVAAQVTPSQPRQAKLSEQRVSPATDR
ncbi:MAG: trypsin-like peptidase domain-containing protein [Planctomycetes bacterium]|nr:trypsin-like peptidase domain-containing protein [Planctomycetota bacterium]